MKAIAKNERIFLTGHRGMVGKAFQRYFNAKGYSNILTATRQELDLINQASVKAYFEKEKPEVLVLCAARVGGIKANIDHPAEFLYENLMIQANLIHAAHEYGCNKIIFLGSSCIYPRESIQPMKEEYLLTGPLEPTNEGYALAKIAGMKMTEYYHRQYGMDVLNVMPSNLYGPGDHFDLSKSHVLSALVKRFSDAKKEGAESITLWGNGSARREFLHVDDLVEGIFFLVENYHEVDFINLGCGTDVSIKELAEEIKEQTGFEGTIEWDTTKPNGMPRKMMDVSRINELGWSSRVDLKNGIAEMITLYNSGAE